MELIFIRLMAWIFLASSCNAFGFAGSNVKPGDADYPVQNPNPKKYLSFHGTIEAPLSIKIFARWVATNPDCQFYLARLMGATQSFGADFPLPLNLGGNRYSTKVAVDGVIPGRCAWQFAGLRYEGEAAMGRDLVGRGDPLARPDSPNIRMELGCKLGPSRIFSGKQELLCGDYNWKRGTRSNDFGFWYSGTNDIEVNFHKSRNP